jgi:hypothetical protein
MDNAGGFAARIGGTIVLLVVLNAVSYFMDCGFFFY